MDQQQALPRYKDQVTDGDDGDRHLNVIRREYSLIQFTLHSQ